LLLLTRVPGPEPAALAERVLAALRPLLARFGAEVEVDVRVGTSRAPADGLDALTLIETAGERAG
jgi:hypothetical protein